MAGSDLPGGVIGRRRDDLHLMAARGEPGRHLAGEFPDTGGLGRKIQAVDEDAQTSPQVFRATTTRQSPAPSRLFSQRKGKRNPRASTISGTTSRGSRKAAVTLPGRALRRAMIVCATQRAG